VIIPESHHDTDEGNGFTAVLFMEFYRTMRCLHIPVFPQA